MNRGRVRPRRQKSQPPPSLPRDRDVKEGESSQSIEICMLYKNIRALIALAQQLMEQ